MNTFRWQHGVRNPISAIIFRQEQTFIHLISRLISLMISYQQTYITYQQTYIARVWLVSVICCLMINYQALFSP